MSASPDSLLPEYLAQYRGDRVTVVAVAFIVLEVFFIGLRFLARQKTISSAGWDDYLAALGLVANLGLCTLGIVEVRVSGIGYHLEAVLLQDVSRYIAWAKCVFAAEQLYLAAVALPKLSILCLYLRIFVEQRSRALAYILVVVVVLNWTTFTVAGFLQCVPFSHLWNKRIPGHCVNIPLALQMTCVPNIVIDVAMLALPMPMVWNLKASRPQKIGLTVVFLAGSLGLIVSCVRLAIYCKEDSYTDNTWKSVPLTNLSIIESGMYMIANCLVALKPLFAQIRFTRPSSSSKDSSTVVFLDPLPYGRSGFAKIQPPSSPSSGRVTVAERKSPWSTWDQADEEQGIRSACAKGFE